MQQGRTTTSMNSEPPPESKITKNPPSLSSLPNEIIVSCLALLPRSYYPQLSPLVSRTFYSVILSAEILIERRNNKTQENFLHVCLQLPRRSLPAWFTLWIKPNQPLINELEEEVNKSTVMLVPIPCSYSPSVPTSYIGTVGSKYYELIQDSTAPLPCHHPLC
ncbi:putative F-box/kelch-repeat protein [Raphanus sativus]|nr:putative F-box/kelch-repeat protein [Raphanus sativus]